MLEQLSRHSLIDMSVKAKGDLHIDDHHTVEDTGICLGKAFKKALGEKAGIVRFGHAAVPMDDALAMSVVDLSGRAYFRYSGPELRGYINRYSEELTTEFLRSFAANAECNIHVMLFYGETPGTFALLGSAVIIGAVVIWTIADARAETSLSD